MGGTRPIWLVNNEASGSNDDRSLQALEACCGNNGFHVARRSVFPRQALPRPADLQGAGIDCVAVFAGDGTINSLLTALAGWDGEVLVLPGGTMNLLFHRLHGDRSLEEVISAAAAGEARRSRPAVVRCPAGVAYAGILAGPATHWGKVREAMREQAIVDLAAEALEAIEESLAGEAIACVDPALGRREGYPLITLNPGDGGIEVCAYYAESATEYVAQAWALLRRNFREGPHERIGVVERVRIDSLGGHPYGLLIDGEEVEQAPSVEFVLGESEVDLLATGDHG